MDGENIEHESPGETAGESNAPPAFYVDEDEEEEEKAVDVTEIHFKYTKPRSAFGRQTQFLEDRARIHCGLKANRERYHPLFQQKKIVDKAEDTSPALHDLSTNTARVEYRSVSVLHGEGGWGKDMNPKDKEQIEKARKKLQKEESYLEALPILVKEAEYLVKHNNALGLTEPLNKSVYISKRNAKPTANVVAVYSSPSFFKRPVTSINFSPGGSGRMATAYCPYEFDPTFRRHPCEAYVWEVENATRPEGMVRAAAQIVDLRYHPRDWYTMCGALFSGQVCTWDNRVGPNPQAISSFDVSHHDVCKSALWTNSDHEFFSCGLDGSVVWWDGRNLSERVAEVRIAPEGSSGPVPITALEYDPSQSEKFLLGTQFGQVIVNEKEAGITCLYKAHKGPVSSVSRNPAFRDNFMSCGGYVIRIFAEECKESGIMWTAPSETLYSCAQWLPQRPCCMVASRVDGCVEFWDLLAQGSVSILTTKLTDDALSTVCPTPDGGLIACGTARGDIRVVEVSSLTQFSNGDKKELKSLFSRELRREQGLAERLRAFKDKEAGIDEQEQPEVHTNTAVLTDKDFFEMLEQEKARLGVGAFPEKGEVAEAHNQMLIQGRMSEMKKVAEKSKKFSGSELGAAEAMEVQEETMRKATDILHRDEAEDEGSGGFETSPEGGDEGSPGGGDEDSPGGGDEDSPGGGDEDSPGGGDEGSPGGGDDDAATGGDDGAATGGDEVSAGGGGAEESTPADAEDDTSSAQPEEQDE